MSELLPCPFCGPGQSQVSLWHDDMSKRWRVGCGRCGCSTGIHPRDKTEAPAIAAWNTRPPVQAPGVDSLTRAKREIGLLAFAEQNAKVREGIDIALRHLAELLREKQP